MTRLALIGGSGVTSLPGLEITSEKACPTPYGDPSAQVIYGKYAGREIIFLPRHGNPHVIPPHKINYRANIWALKACGANTIISINAVGGITARMYPGRLVIPHQIIDYTSGRAHTFFEEGLAHPVHIDFTNPYAENLRELLINCADQKHLDACPEGTYAASQGPRLETAAEIRRMEQDGCDIVGMTAMPEAALARELALDYASLSIVVNQAAGKSEEIITMAVIKANMERALAGVHQLLMALIAEF